MRYDLNADRSHKTSYAILTLSHWLASGYESMVHNVYFTPI